MGSVNQGGFGYRTGFDWLRDLSIKTGLVTGLGLIVMGSVNQGGFGNRTGFDWLRDLSIKAGLVTGLGLIGYGICQSRWVWLQDWV